MSLLRGILFAFVRRGSRSNVRDVSRSRATNDKDAQQCGRSGVEELSSLLIFFTFRKREPKTIKERKTYEAMSCLGLGSPLTKPCLVTRQDGMSCDEPRMYYCSDRQQDVVGPSPSQRPPRTKTREDDSSYQNAMGSMRLLLDKENLWR